jgi:hypothetical protein
MHIRFAVEQAHSFAAHAAVVKPSPVDAADESRAGCMHQSDALLDLFGFYRPDLVRVDCASPVGARNMQRSDL